MAGGGAGIRTPGEAKGTGGAPGPGVNPALHHLQHFHEQPQPPRLSAQKGRNGSSSNLRPASAGSAAGGARATAAPTSGRSNASCSSRSGAAGVVLAYLKVHGLGQYAKGFEVSGFTDLESIARLSDVESLEFLDKLRVYPGHRLRLLRAIDMLRHAALGAERRDASQQLEDDAALERLCSQNEELVKQRSEKQDEVKRLQEENHRLLEEAQQQGLLLQKARDRVAELEEFSRAQTEQVNFLAQQLQIVAAGAPGRESELYRSYKSVYDDTHVDNDWRGAERIQLPDGPQETSKSASEAAAAALSDRLGQAAAAAQAVARSRSILEANSLAPPSTGIAAAFIGAGDGNNDATALKGRRGYNSGTIADRREASGEETLPLMYSQGKSRLASTMGAEVRECLAGFDVDHIIKCLATALHNRLILVVTKPRPHSASQAVLAACTIFVEPACLEHLKKRMGRNKSISLSNSLATEDLNDMAVRSPPNRWDVYGFLRDVMVNFRLEPEVSVITLIYIDRFVESSGVVLTPDNWQRLTIAAMMLASKVWNDESFENVEFAQLCPLYTLDEINAFERIFLKCVGYNVSTKGSEYAKTYFILRTLGAKDSGEFGLEPMDNARATRLQERCLEKQVEFRERYPEDAMAAAMNWTL